MTKTCQRVNMASVSKQEIVSKVEKEPQTGSQTSEKMSDHLPLPKGIPQTGLEKGFYKVSFVSLNFQTCCKR